MNLHASVASHCKRRESVGQVMDKQEANCTTVAVVLLIRTEGRTYYFDKHYPVIKKKYIHTYTYIQKIEALTTKKDIRPKIQNEVFLN